MSVLLLLLVLTFARAAGAASVTIAWDPNPEPDVAGYFVHYGDKPGVYQQKVRVGDVLSWTVDGLVAGKTYYFALQAYTTGGVLSPLSSPVSATISGTTPPPPPPPPPPLPPAQFTTRSGAEGRLASRTLQWTVVSDALAYYLYVGSAPGAKDVVDTGEIGTTSFSVPRVASERVLFARLWTKQGTSWRFTDMSFMLPVSAAPAQLLSPISGETSVSAARVFQWTPVATAAAYYLYVGTRSGAKDVVDTGEIAGTSWTVPSMPLAKHLYARIWTKIDDGWYFRETEFDTAKGAQFVYPADGASDVSAKEVFKWTAVTEARGYYLYVGTMPGANDVVDSHEIKTTSYEVKGLAPGQTLYARLWTAVGWKWVSIADITFRTSLTSRLTQPLDNSNTGLATTFKWTPVLGADAYYLYVGTKSGAKNVIDSGETVELEHPSGSLAARSQFYARMWTKLAGGWRFRDSTFIISGAGLTTPEPGATVASSHLFEWTAVPNAQCYYLYVGDTPGAKNIVDTGEIASTSWLATLPTGKTLYATLWTKVNGGWSSVQSSFIVKP